MKIHNRSRWLPGAFLALLTTSSASAQGPPPELNLPGGTLCVTAGTLEEVDDLGRRWRPDTQFLVSTGTNIAIFAEEFVTFDLSLISDQHVPFSVWRTERWKDGDIRYQVRVHNAPYKVYIYFIETCGVCVGPAMGGSGCAGCARIFDVEVEGLRSFSYNQSDAAVGGPSDGVGATFKATELVFDVEVTDSVLDLALIDLGSTNPPENSAIKGFKVVRMPSELETFGGTLRLNAGSSAGAAVVVDGLGRRWEDDAPYLKTTGTQLGAFVDPTITSLLRDRTVPPQVFLSERWKDGEFQYEVPVRNGVYETHLYFAENWPTCVGPGLGGTGCAACARIFDVEVEGKLYDGYQPADAGVPPLEDGRGALSTASELVFFTSVEDGFLDIDFRDLGAGDPPENPQINAMTITRLDAGVLRPPETIDIGLQINKGNKLYLIESTPGRPVVITASADTAFGASTLYVDWQSVPTPGNHEISAVQHPGSSACLVAPGRAKGSWLLLVHSDYSGPEKFKLTVNAEVKGFGLKSMTPAAAARDSSGAISAAIQGFGFAQQTTFVLRPHLNLLNFAARETHIVSPTRAEVVFDVSSAAPGTYDLFATRNGSGFGRVPETAGLNPAFELKSPQKGPIVDFSLQGFGAYRKDQLSRVTLRYRNEGDVEIPAPIFKVEGPGGVQLRLRSDEDFQGNVLLVLGADEENVAGRLSPGTRWHEVHVYFQSSLALRTELKVSLFSPSETDLVPWSSLPAPPGVTAQQWQTLRALLPAKAGTKWREYGETLGRTASRLHRRGDDASNTSSLFRFVSRQALGQPTGGVTGSIDRESTGEPEKGVTVLARQGGVTQASGSTDQDGFFAIDRLLPGQEYSISLADWATASPTTFTTIPGDDVHGIVLFAHPAANGLPAECPNCTDTGIPRRAVIPPPELFAGSRSHVLEEIRSQDPNDKRGPRKPDQAGMEDRTCSGDDIEYQIRFENVGNAAAQSIEISDTLSTSVFDESHFRFTEVVLGDVVYPLTTVVVGGVVVPSGEGFGASATIEGVGTLGLVCVVVSGSFEPSTGFMEITLQAIDPLTGVAPLDASLGVLEAGQHGTVSFATMAEGDLDEGTEVKNSGEIIFDDNAPVPTNTYQNHFSSCAPEAPHSPVPNDRTVPGVGVDVLLGWESANADTFDVFLGPSGTQRTLRAHDIPERGFRPTGIAPDKVYEWQVRAKNPRGTADGPVWRFSTKAPTSTSFRRGDVNSDGKQDISDAVFILKYLFSGGAAPPCEKAADIDDSGTVIITDPVNLLGHLFLGLPAPPPPFSTCGSDPSSDALQCASGCL